MRVLIVDDSRTMRRFLEAIVVDLSMEAVQATDGADGMRILEQSGPFDIAMVDWDMPVIDGLKFIGLVRARPEFEATKLLMVTARTSYDEVARALDQGADDFLMKPLTPAMVADKFRILGLID